MEDEQREAMFNGWKLKEDEKHRNCKNHRWTYGGISNSNFTFTVSDGYCTYSYPLNISTNNSVYDVVKKIYKAFKLKKENGTLVKP